MGQVCANGGATGANATQARRAELPADVPQSTVEAEKPAAAGAGRARTEGRNLRVDSVAALPLIGFEGLNGALSHSLQP